MRLKKLAAIGLAAVMAASTLTGCSGGDDSADGKKKIGVVQLVEHDALDSAYKGFKDGLEEAGYKDGDTVDATVAESSEIRQVVESLKGKVDAIYSPTDNMIAAGINTVSMVANEAKLPLIVGEEGMCQGGGLATYGINYYKLGKQTAAQAVKILKGEAEPKDMPIEYQENADLIINEDTAKELGITIPDNLKKEAKMVTTQKTAE